MNIPQGGVLCNCTNQCNSHYMSIWYLLLMISVLASGEKIEEITPIISYPNIIVDFLATLKRRVYSDPIYLLNQRSTVKAGHCCRRTDNSNFPLHQDFDLFRQHGVLFHTPPTSRNNYLKALNIVGQIRRDNTCHMQSKKKVHTFFYMFDLHRLEIVRILQRSCYNNITFGSVL